jgi:ribonuclease VapC
MFVDASVIVAILGREADGAALVERLRSDDIDNIYISPLVRFEAVAALARIKTKEQGADFKPTRESLMQARASVDALAEWMGAKIVDISTEVGDAAINASSIYGKIVGHPAELNFGDCFAYACAKALGVPLAYKGNDFALTDLA